MTYFIKLDLRQFLPRAVHLICGKTVIAMHVRTQYAHANKQAGRQISKRQETRNKKQKEIKALTEKAIDNPR